MIALALLLAGAARAALPVDIDAVALPSDLPGLEAAAVSAEPAARLAARARIAEAQNPALAALVAGAEPRPSRSGAPLFTQPALATPAATPLLLARVARGDDPAALRVALLAAAARAGGPWADDVAWMAGVEGDPEVRRMLVELLDRAPWALARPALLRALAAPDAGSRAAAARSLGHHTDGAQARGALIGALADADADVRAAAAQSLGWLQAAEAWGPLLRALSDADADVRLRAVRALQRIDPARAAAAPELGVAAGDPDEKVRRAAIQVQAG